MKRTLLLATASVLAMINIAAAEERTALTANELSATVDKYLLVQNDAFLPPKDAAAAVEKFEGTLSLSEMTMLTEPAKFKNDKVLGKNPHVFPGVSLSFVTVGGDLVPTTQDVIRNGSIPGSNSYWDIIAQPGKVWSEKTDDGWSRASFPFALMHSIEGETHNGVATFLYKGDKVTNLRFQILTQTSPFYVEDYFTASGSVPAKFVPGTPPGADAAAERFRKAEAVKEPIHAWAELEQAVGPDKLKGFDSKIRPAEIVLDGISLDDKFYLKSCPTPAGELPYCDRQRFGVWSMTKSAANAATLLRIAEKYGEDVFDAKIVDYVTEAKGLPGWDKVTFGDALNMATGMGVGNDKPTDPMGEPYDAAYYAWYEAPTTAAKLEAMLKAAKPYTWGPGKVARYRDEDMFLLGVAMTRFLQTKEGPNANAWDFLEKEVYEPIGIYDAPMNKTIEADPSKDQPLMAYGFYPTIGDLLKIARLYHNDGKFEGKQILNAEMLADTKPAIEPVGLATGNAQKPNYRKAFWRAVVPECKLNFPMMDGWGSNYVLLLPHDLTVVRLAKNWDGDEGADNVDNLTAVAAKLKPLCQ